MPDRSTRLTRLRMEIADLRCEIRQMYSTEVSVFLADYAERLADVLDSLIALLEKEGGP